MAWKAWEGCVELVLVQPCPWQALVLVAGHAYCGAASKTKPMPPAMPFFVLSGFAQPLSLLPS